jgi:hypothetical protein
MKRRNRLAVLKTLAAPKKERDGMEIIVWNSFVILNLPKTVLR